jgi:FAD/FMN-containing dehydrogenase
VLKPQLDGKVADVIVSPTTIEQLCAVLALAVKHRVPVTPKGAGTGNYGQGVPIHGGILLSMLKLDKILEITPYFARVQAGVKLIDVELRARTMGSEMRFYPSTVLTSTAAGFIAGGAGGIGSLRWGTVWDEGNITSVSLVTVEAQPRVIRVDTHADMLGVIHNCGLTCIIAELTYALAPAQPWEQFALAFDGFDDAVRYGMHLALDTPFESRLISTHEPGITPFFKQLVRIGATPAGKAAVLLEAAADKATVSAVAAAHNGAVAWHGPHETYHKSSVPQLSNFSYNHTTLWAMQADPGWTYIQNAFDADKVLEQHHALKARYGDRTLTHIEWLKWGGVITPAGLNLVRFESREQLWELMAFCDSIGAWVANAHSHKLDDDVRWNGQPVLDAKRRWDPHNLLNPGHLTGQTA